MTAQQHMSAVKNGEVVLGALRETVTPKASKNDVSARTLTTC